MPWESATATAARTRPPAPRTQVIERPREDRWGTFNVPPRAIEPREIHVAPLFGPTHTFTIDCWCHPSRDPEDTRLIVHNVAH